MDIKEQVLAEMRKPELYREKVLKYVEENIEDAFHLACRKNISLNEWQPDATFGNQLNQKTVLLTVRMFDLWETALVDVLNNHLSKKFEGVRVEPAHDSVGDLVIILPDKSEVKWEVKTTQGQDSFTGATHSASKCNNYILISYAIDKDKKLKPGANPGFIIELAVFVWDSMTAKWQGLPSENSSWTTLKFKADIPQTKKEIIVIGSLQPKTTWCQIIREKLGKNSCLKDYPVDFVIGNPPYQLEK